MAKNSSLIKSLIKRQEFSYSKNDVNLKFTLRIDNSSELRLFLDCLESAKQDIEDILKGMNN